MNSKDYIKDAIRTESKDFQSISMRLNIDAIRLLHGVMGLETEVGEFMDGLKKHIFYGKPLDRVNLKEELGDLFWYLAILCDVLGSDFETIMRINIEKLKARYGDKFTEDGALNRNVDVERSILEKE